MANHHSCAQFVSNQSRSFLSALLLLSCTLSPLSATRLSFSDLLDSFKETSPLVSSEGSSAKEKDGGPLTRELSAGDCRKIVLTYAGQKVTGYVEDLTRQRTIVKTHDMPLILRQILTPQIFAKFLEESYGQVHRMNNGDVRFSIHQRGLGGMKRKPLQIETGDSAEALSQESLTHLPETVGIQILGYFSLKDRESVKLTCNLLNKWTWQATTTYEFSHSLSSQELKEAIDGVALKDSSYVRGIEKLIFRGNVAPEHCRQIASSSFYSNALKALYFHFCREMDTCLPQITKLTGLTELGFNDCNTVSGTTINEVLSHLSNFSSLKKLEFMNSSHLNDIGVSHLAKLPGLTFLSFMNCRQITDAGLAHIAKLSLLTQLDLSYCYDIESLSHLSNLTSLKKLDLNSCYEIRGLSHLSTLSSLMQLNLKRCGRITDAELVHIENLSSLETLNLENSNINGAGLSYLSQFSSLIELILSDCNQLTDVGLAHIGKLPSIKRLMLNNCFNITNTGLAYLTHLSSLEMLNLAGGLCNSKNMWLTDRGLAHIIGNLSSLKQLNLMWCGAITDTGLSHLDKLSSLTFLKLWNCKNITDAGVQSLKSALPLLTIGERR